MTHSQWGWGDVVCPPPHKIYDIDIEIGIKWFLYIYTLPTHPYIFVNKKICSEGNRPEKFDFLKKNSLQKKIIWYHFQWIMWGGGEGQRLHPSFSHVFNENDSYTFEIGWPCMSLYLEPIYRSY